MAGPANRTSSAPALTTTFAHLLPGFRGDDPAHGLVSRVHRQHAWSRLTKAHGIFASFLLAYFCLKLMTAQHVQFIYFHNPSLISKDLSNLEKLV